MRRRVAHTIFGRGKGGGKLLTILGGEDLFWGEQKTIEKEIPLERKKNLPLSDNKEAVEWTEIDPLGAFFKPSEVQAPKTEKLLSHTKKGGTSLLVKKPRTKGGIKRKSLGGGRVVISFSDRGGSATPS